MTERSSRTLPLIGTTALLLALIAFVLFQMSPRQIACDGAASSMVMGGGRSIDLGAIRSNATALLTGEATASVRGVVGDGPLAIALKRCEQQPNSCTLNVANEALHVAVREYSLGGGQNASATGDVSLGSGQFVLTDYLAGQTGGTIVTTDRGRCTISRSILGGIAHIPT